MHVQDRVVLPRLGGWRDPCWHGPHLPVPGPEGCPWDARGSMLSSFAYHTQFSDSPFCYSCSVSSAKRGVSNDLVSPPSGPTGAIMGAGLGNSTALITDGKVTSHLLTVSLTRTQDVSPVPPMASSSVTSRRRLGSAGPSRWWKTATVSRSTRWKRLSSGSTLATRRRLAGGKCGRALGRTSSMSSAVCSTDTPVTSRSVLALQSAAAALKISSKSADVGAYCD
jgi:hypothetical protein